MNHHLEVQEDEPLARLLDTALGEIMGGREAPDVEAQVLARLHGHGAASRKRSRLRGLLAAALVLVGVAAVCGVALLRPTGVRTAQEPECDDLRPDFYPDISQRILKPDTRFLVLMAPLDEPGLLDRIVALPHLRRLQLLTNGKPITDAALAAIAQLSELEDLSLPRPTTGSIHALLPAPKLHTLTVVGRVALDDSLAAALVDLPHLRTLRLQGVDLTRTGFRKLADSPHLENLRVDHALGCTTETLQQLKGFMSLQRLELHHLGRTPLVPETAKKPQDPESCGLTAPIARALASLPLLEDVALESTELTDDAIQELPLRLRRLSLVRCPDITPAQLRALRRLVHLESLHLDRVDERWCPDVYRGFPRPPFGPSDRWQAQADLLRALPLREVAYDWFQPPDEVIAALADLPHLQSLILHSVGVDVRQPEDDDLGYLSRLRGLERLRLVDFLGTTEDLGVLRNARALRELDAGGMPYAGLRGEALRNRLEQDLPGVRVRVRQ